MSKTDKPAEDKPAEATPASAKPKPLGSKIINSPNATNTGGYELKVPPVTIVSRMAGHNTGGFELRATQEQGAH